MILIKQVGVYLNLVHNRFKQYVGSIFQERGVDLTPEQFLVMDILWKDNVLSQQQIATIVMKDKNSITKLLDQLEKKELIVRIPDKIDRRLNLIKLTDKGWGLKDISTDIATEAVNRIVDGIPDDDLNNFVETLMKMGDNIRKTDNRPNEN